MWLSTIGKPSALGEQLVKAAQKLQWKVLFLAVVLSSIEMAPYAEGI